MRRRALLAASSGKTGNLPSFNFPIYLEWDYCDTSPLFGYCERKADELTISLYDYLFIVLETEGQATGNARSLSQEQLTTLGIEIYIQGERVYEIECDDISYRSFVFLDYPSQMRVCWLSKEGYMYDGN